MNRRALHALGALAVAGTLGVPATAQERPDLVVAVNDLPGSLESAEEMGNIAVRITYSMFDSLIRRDFLADGSGMASKLEPGLAESWERIDPDTIELKLREGVTFHNGNPFTAEDVQFSLSPERLTGEDAAVAQGPRFMGTLGEVEIVDDHTVRVHSKEPDLVLDQRLAGYASWIVDKETYLAGGETLLEAKDAYGRNPVGTGPYMLDEWVDGDFIRLKAFDEYWGGRPTAASITFKEVPETAARVAGLVSGEFDIIVNVPPDQIPVLARYDDVETREVVLDNSHVLIFYQDQPHMQDKKVRQALALAIDRDLLREALWDDKNYTPNAHQLPSYTMYMEDFPGFAYDPEKAKQLLAESSYDGEPIVYRLPLNYYLNSMEAAQAIQQMWEEVGFNVSLEPVENFTQANEEGVNVRVWSNTHRMPDPIGSFVPQWGPRSGIQNNAQYPERNWQPPARYNELNDLIETSTSMEERQAAYREALEIWMDEAPGTILYNPLETYGVKKGIAWQPYGLYYMDFRPYNLQFTDAYSG